MRPALLTEPADALPSNPRRGFAGTAALHAAAAAMVLLMAASGAGLSPDGSTDTGTADGPLVVRVPPPVSLPPPVLVVDGPALPAVAAMPPPAPFTTDDGFTYDTSRIRLRRHVLFPFLTGRLPFLDDMRAAAVVNRERLRSPLGGGRRQSRERPPLELSDSARDALVDGSWSRRDRWRSLATIVDLAGRHDPDDGQLPALVRGHVEKNLLQPYLESSAPDPRFWVMLGLAADHLDVIEFVGRFAQQHPSSRTTTELLFLLDELAEANRAAFELLMQTNIARLERTARSSPHDVQLGWQLQRGYKTWTRDRGLDEPKARDAHYDAVRLAILTTIIETSPNGYGAADARFVAGRLLWDRSDVDGAVRMWRGMAADERTAYASVRADIRAALLPDGRVDVLRIVRALGAERGRWLRDSSERLTRFGYTPQKF